METLRVVEAGRGMGNNCKDFQYDYDSACSTPYVSAPSSPGRGGFYFSAPTSPVRCSVSHLPCRLEQNLALEQSLAQGISMEEEAEAEAEAASAVAVSPSGSGGSDFEFSARFTEFEGPAVTADELFCNGQIRPMKLATHLERPQLLRPLIDFEGKEAEKPGAAQMRMAAVEEEGESSSGRERGLWRDKSKSSRHRRTRSLSPLRSAPQWETEAPEPCKLEENDEDDKSKSNGAGVSAGPSKRRGGSRRWMSLKDFLYRSKSEGRGHTRERVWALSFSSPAKQASEKHKNNSKKTETPVSKQPEKSKTVAAGSKKTNSGGGAAPVSNSNRHGQGQRRAPVSAHELHYTANRAQSEELRRKTYLPYRQGLLGCLGFSSKSYTTMNGFAKTLHPLS